MFILLILITNINIFHKSAFVCIEKLNLQV